MAEFRETNGVGAPPWTDGLVAFYSFLAECLAVWKGSLDDYHFPIPPSVEKLIDVVEPRTVLLDPEDLRFPLFLINVSRKLMEKPKLRLDKGIGHFRERKFIGALLEDLETAPELARTIRLVGVFARYQPVTLRTYALLIDSELSAFEAGRFSEKTLNRLVPATLLFIVGAAAVWSAFVANFLGLDLLKFVWDLVLRSVASTLGFWSEFAAWGVFAVGLLGIAGWAVGRHQSLNQSHRLWRIHRCLKLYLVAFDPQTDGTNKSLHQTPQSGAAEH